VTGSMSRAIAETERRREMQLAYNAEHGIEPQTIQKAIVDGIETQIASRHFDREMVGESEREYATRERVRELEGEMLAAAEVLDFERAARLRDELLALQGKKGDFLKPQASRRPYARRRRRRGR
jgi:excinuclease ABC subunit B